MEIGVYYGQFVEGSKRMPRHRDASQNNDGRVGADTLKLEEPVVDHLAKWIIAKLIELVKSNQIKASEIIRDEDGGYCFYHNSLKFTVWGSDGINWYDGEGHLITRTESHFALYVDEVPGYPCTFPIAYNLRISSDFVRDLYLAVLELLWLNQPNIFGIKLKDHLGDNETKRISMLKTIQDRLNT
jgi:hypothetical protein